MSNIMSEGFTCECGTYHRFTVYVAAHWRDALMHTCEVCQAEHQIQRGKAAFEVIEMMAARIAELEASLNSILRHTDPDGEDGTYRGKRGR